MAEVQVTPQRDTTVRYDSELRPQRRTIARFMSNTQSSIYPATLSSLFFLITLVTSFFAANVDVSFGGIHLIGQFIRRESLSPLTVQMAACIVFSFGLWVISILLLRYTLRLLLLYKGWMKETPLKKTSVTTYIWAIFMKMLTKRRPMLYSFQGCLPLLPLPSLKETMERYLCTVRPLLDEEKYENIKKLAIEFQNGVGKKLQFHLWIKSWWATNYVSDWWEEYAYVSQRRSLLTYSNVYGLDYLLIPTTNQAARAATVIYAALIFKFRVDTQNLKPVTIQNFIPLCALQYKRIFNTTRIPGVEKDSIVHQSDSQHIVVYHNGRYYKVMICDQKRIFTPVELQWQIQQILDDSSVPAPGEHQLAALTTNNRTIWANARTTYFSEGLNKDSLKAIENATLFLLLHDEDLEIDTSDSSFLNKYAQAAFHGTGFNLWLDKSINFIIFKNCRVALNFEHSWCDAPVITHLFEFIFDREIKELKYQADGNASGEFKETPPLPKRLKWDLQTECLDLIKSSTFTAMEIIADVDLQVLYYSDYGKNFMKKCKIGPDAFVQMVLQLAYYRETGCFPLTYETAMMRLFRKGRTDTIRTVTMESCDFVLSVDNPDIPIKEKLAFFQRACQKHQETVKNVMCGKGVDRHIFCLYVSSKILDVESPFLEKVISEPWKLCTSQIPFNQTGVVDPKNFPLSGGFRQLTDDGYEVSYNMTSEKVLIFHVCSKRTSPATDTARFIRHLEKSLHDVKKILL